MQNSPEVHPIELAIENRPLNADQRAWRRRILFSTYWAYAGFYLVRKVFTLCKTTLAEEYGIGYEGVANIWTIFLVGYMIGQFVSSFIGRKWGPRLLLLGGLGTSIAINLIFGFANSYATFMVFMFFNGLVQAAGWPGAVGGVAEWLRNKERGTIMGFWSTNYVVGNIVVKMLGGYLLLHYTSLYDGHYGVRYAFLGCTLLAFGIWWLVYFLQRNRPEDVGVEPIVDHEHFSSHSVEATTNEHASFKQYLPLLLNPVVPLMGLSYFTIKFLRYALDSWLPTFLDLQGMDVAQAAYFSSIFDWAGLAGAIFAGIALDSLFGGHWDRLCLVMGLGIVGGYLLVLSMGTHPVALAVNFGLVGFMLYGPDTLLCGAGAVVVAGPRNAVAVAGLVNGMGSIGPVLQEQITGRILAASSSEVAVHSSNLLGLSMSILFVFLMILICWQSNYNRKRRAASHAST